MIKKVSILLLFITIVLIASMSNYTYAKEGEESLKILDGTAFQYTRNDIEIIEYDSHSLELPNFDFYFFSESTPEDSYYVADVLKEADEKSIITCFCVYYNKNVNDYNDVNIQIYLKNEHTYYNLHIVFNSSLIETIKNKAIVVNKYISSETINRLHASMDVYSVVQSQLTKDEKCSIDFENCGKDNFKQMIIKPYFHISNDNENLRDLNERVYSYNSYSTNYDNYTNSNGIINSYVSSYFGNHSLPNGDITDDPIVQIIPKELCFEVGYHLYIGREYGFFINTSIDSINSCDYCVDILVFDIIFSKHNILSTNGVGSLKIKPIFEYRYRAVDKERRNNMWNGFDQSLTRVVYNHLHYDAAEYYLHDISVKHCLENEVCLNYGDDGYIDEYDNGDFFISSSIVIDGVGLKKYKGNFIKDTLSFGMGMISNVYSIVEYLATLYGYGTYQDSLTYGSDYTVNTYAPNRYYQLTNYNYLIKKINTTKLQSSEKMVIFGINNYYQSQYTASCYDEELSTRVINSIRLSVGVDYTSYYLFGLIPVGEFNSLATGESFYSTSKEKIAVYKSSYNDLIEYKGDSTFYRFIPEYTGNYVIETHGDIDTIMNLYDSNNVLLSYDDDSGDGYNSRIKINLTKDNEYYIQVSGFGDSVIGSYSFNILYNFYDAQSIYTNGVTSVNITEQYGFKLYKFIPTSSNRYCFETKNTNTDPYLVLLDENLNVMTSNDDGGSGLNAKIEYTLISYHPFYVMARCFGTRTGQFDLEVTIE